jgi:filamentous hemagglutinin family protein
MTIANKLLILASWLLFTSVLHAEAVLDGTLGTKDSFFGNFTITEKMGELRGNNLFHSFKTFNIKADKKATFTGSNAIRNVISRVTGGSRSHINGTLYSEMSANFYLLNPNGIMFGKGAKLDINGSFHASTADYLQLKDGTRFSAVHPNSSSLTIAPISDFGFSENPAKITITGSYLELEPKNTLSFTAGDFDIKDSKLFAHGGQINLISQKLGAINISGQTEISADSEKGANYNGGNIFIKANTMTLKEGCYKNCGIHSDTYGKYHGGKIDIKVSKKLTINDLNVISAASDKETTGNGGEVNLEVGQLILKDGGMINTGTKGSGNGGKINIEADESITLIGLESRISNSVSSSGNGGNIFIKTPRLEIGGLFSAVQTGTYPSSAGDSGDITIHADDIKLKNMGHIISASAGSGNAGNIKISSNEIQLDGGLIISGTINEKNAGSISISANNMSLNNSLVTSLSTQGSGSDINFQVDNYLSLKDSFIVTRTDGSLDDTKGGDFFSKAASFLFNNSQLDTTAVAGDGGNINIHADKLTALGNSRIDISSKYGMNGKFILNDTQLPNVDTLPPDGFLGAGLSMDRCAGIEIKDMSTFYITSRDIPPPTPMDLRTSNYFPKE